MALIQDLVGQVEDPTLRERILQEINRMNGRRKFGLVFEEHLPECTPLYDVPVKRGAKAAPRDGEASDIHIVQDITDGIATCVRRSDKETVEIPVADLVSVAEFGDPIYPCLKPVDTVENAPDDPVWHTLIQADNYHALQLLEYLYAGKVDCIYIDPPYNTGAHDWKYNNDYVDGSDQYRHSKWLSFIERRLKIAKKLLNPRDSVLIVTIDEKEYNHLGCLLEQMFPEANVQMVSSVINPSGVSRLNQFYRTDEYIYFVCLGSAGPRPLPLTDEWMTTEKTSRNSLTWRTVRRRGAHDSRAERPNLFYPIFISEKDKRIVGAGDSLPIDEKVEDAPIRQGTFAVWPYKPGGGDGRWQISQETLMNLVRKGYVRINHSAAHGYVLSYLAAGEQRKIESGLFRVTGYAKDGSVIVDDKDVVVPFLPGTQWRIPEHNAREYGSALLNGIFPDKRFSFPKSLYAEHDAIRFFVADKPDALILDFFAGSGTTLHAVNLLNAEDGGHRRCILVTNNEVSEDEAKGLTKAGHHPGDPEWESLGIARYVTWPRTVCSIRGVDVNGQPLKGTYIGSDRPMSDGFKANAAFFELGFLNPHDVQLGSQFRALLPVLWMKAGCFGPCPALPDGESLPDMMVLPGNRMAVLLDETGYASFRGQLDAHPEIRTVFIVTNSGAAYRRMAGPWPDRDCVQLYRDYLDNFRINTGKRS